MKNEPTSGDARSCAFVYAKKMGNSQIDPRMVALFETIESHVMGVWKGQQKEHQELLSLLGTTHTMRKQKLESVLRWIDEQKRNGSDE